MSTKIVENDKFGLLGIEMCTQIAYIVDIIFMLLQPEYGSKFGEIQKMLDFPQLFDIITKLSAAMSPTDPLKNQELF